MKTQIVYETNASYEATYHKLAKSGVVVVDKTQKGLIWFRVKGTKTVFTLSPYGKLQVKWSNPLEKKILFRIVKNLMVPEEGQKLRMLPTGQQTFIPYPEPPSFKLYWCDEETEYIRKQVSNRKRESVIVTFITIAIASIFGFITLHGLSKEVSPLVSNQTGLEGVAMKIMLQISPYVVLAPIVILPLIAILLKLRPSIPNKLKRFRF